MDISLRSAHPAEQVASPSPTSTPAGAAAAVVSEREFGGRVIATERTVNVGTVATRLLQNDPGRVGWLIANRSVNNGAWSYLPTVTALTGIPLAAGSGFTNSRARDDGESTGAELWACNATAAGDWTVIEYSLAGLPRA